MKQALKLQKERGAIFTLHEYLEELSRCQSRKFLKNVKVQPVQPILLLLLLW